MITGVIFGLLLGVIYIMASWLTYRLASGQSDATFFKIYFGGMTVRMFVTLLAVGVVLLVFDVPEIAFLGAFFLVFVLGLVLEVLLLHRRQSNSNSP